MSTSLNTDCALRNQRENKKIPFAPQDASCNSSSNMLVIPPTEGQLHVESPRTKTSQQNDTQFLQETLEDAPIMTVDALIRNRAWANPHAPIVAYPSSGIDYVHYTMQQLDVFAYRLAKHYQAWIPCRRSSATKPTTVALLGPSNFDYLVTMLALTKLGHTVLFLSTRISQLAIESLLETTQSAFLLVDPRFKEVAEKVQANVSQVRVYEIASKSYYEFPIEVYADTRLDYHLDEDVEKENNVYIIHSSGSTGLPKPIYQQHKSAIANYAISMNMVAFITLPLYHNHGICNFFRAVHSLKSIHLYNADLPLTAGYLTTVMKNHQFEIFYGVPYALKLMAETDEGIRLLKQLKVVMYGGSACPDTLGDMLVENGVNLISHYGATEVGQLMTSFRPTGDKAWNYVRESDKLKPYLQWIPRGSGLYECTVLEGWPAKVASNMPDGSYATKDLFESHPSLSGAWKYIARLDDTIILVNGEKFNPVVMEGKIRSHKAATEAVIFGASRPYLGVLIIPSPSTAELPDDQIIDQIFPIIEEANTSVEAYARISKDMVKILPHDCQYPRTDKGSVIRQAFYKQFLGEITNAYDSAVIQEELKALSIEGLRCFLHDLFSQSIPRCEHLADDTDFFSIGCDSLQAIQLRTEILKTVDIGNNKLGLNVVFEYPSIARLSAYLYALRTGEGIEQHSAIEDDMLALVKKYGDFAPLPSRFSVAVTGTTGSLGAHVAARLSRNENISRVYCLVRAQDPTDAIRRVNKSFIQRKVYHTLPLAARTKIVALPSDLSDKKLGLSDETYSEMAESLRSVIHCAWSVNFNKNLSSFEKDCIAGVKHLLDLCHAVPGPQPASFDFCSSVSTVARAPTREVPETLPEMSWAQQMGYAQSKLVAENLCVRAAHRTGIRARVLRVGQIVADTVHGVWNATEGIPMMMQTALTVGALPRLAETPSWTPVDVVARSIVEIALSDAGSIIANVTNPRTFRWTEDLLPALRQSGLKFEEVEPREWVRRLCASNPNPVANPPIKLVNFFASKYDRDFFPPSRSYITNIACKFAPALADAPALTDTFVSKFIQQFLSKSWSSSSTDTSTQRKTIIIVAGPCDSDQSTIANALATSISVPFIEGDSLHSKDAMSRKSNGYVLLDSDRRNWLERLQRRAREIVLEQNFDSVVVSCSVVKKVHRDQIRKIRDARRVLDIVFVDLQCEADVLWERSNKSSDHYVTTDGIQQGEIDVYEAPWAEETDMLPVDGAQRKDVVLETVQKLVEDWKSLQ